ncbi:palmitoyltransferase zdhhc16 [Anaeramoeba ignava]|uniref:Palmitoyltransferase n=1 Tax=Anaeramoeba ignava TaxID=1746090 RepID=A0A9Q0LH02_ANAIG|nr:palmitoyltransferase zdhhc16 [Anaeramoeba ignava]
MNQKKQQEKLIFFDKAAFLLFKLFSLVLVLISFILIVVIIYFYFTFMLPMTASENIIIFTIQTTSAIWIIWGISYNYVKAVFTKPGYPPPNLITKEELKQLKKRYKLIKSNPHNSRALKKIPYCPICKNFKPERTHHDALSGKCVLRMDHFCPWINNTVGYKNHKFFILFMVYLILGCIYAAILSSSAFFFDIGLSDHPVDHQGPLIFVFITCLVVIIGVSFLVGFHFYLLLTNQTTIEFYQNQLPNPKSKKGKIRKFDLGKRKNFDQFFGTTNQYWFKFLFNFENPKGDGIHFIKAEKNLNYRYLNIGDSNVII